MIIQFYKIPVNLFFRPPEGFQTTKKFFIKLPAKPISRC